MNGTVPSAAVTRPHAGLPGLGGDARGPAVVLVLLLSGCTASEPPASTPPPAAPSASVSRLDTTNWTVYKSKQYGFTIKHPPGWAVKPAKRAWKLTVDAKNPVSAGQEGFLSAGGDIWVTVWSTPAKGTPETLDGIAVWVEKYCEQVGEPCPAIQDRAMPLCHGKECHPGLMVETAGQEFRAFFTGGAHRGQMVGLSVWRPEWDASVTKYGGARRLLEGFLSGMDVCPALLYQAPSGCPE